MANTPDTMSLTDEADLINELEVGLSFVAAHFPQATVDVDHMRTLLAIARRAHRLEAAASDRAYVATAAAALEG